MLIHSEGVALTKAEKPKPKAKLGPGNTTAGPQAFRIQELVKLLIADFYVSSASEMCQRIEKEAGITQGYLGKFLKSTKAELLRSFEPAMRSVATKLCAWHERYVPENHDGLRGRWLFPVLTEADVSRSGGYLSGPDERKIRNLVKGASQLTQAKALSGEQVPKLTARRLAVIMTAKSPWRGWKLTSTLLSHFKKGGEPKACSAGSWAEKRRRIAWLCYVFLSIAAPSTVVLPSGRQPYTHSSSTAERIDTPDAAEQRGEPAPEEPWTSSRTAARVVADLPGSRGYWKSKLLDLYALIQTAGQPHLFCTLTMNVKQWDVLQVHVERATRERVDFVKSATGDGCVQSRRKRKRGHQKVFIDGPGDPVNATIAYYERLQNWLNCFVYPSGRCATRRAEARDERVVVVGRPSRVILCRVVRIWGHNNMRPYHSAEPPAATAWRPPQCQCQCLLAGLPRTRTHTHTHTHTRTHTRTQSHTHTHTHTHTHRL